MINPRKRSCKRLHRLAKSHIKQLPAILPLKQEIQPTYRSIQRSLFRANMSKIRTQRDILWTQTLIISHKIAIGRHLEDFLITKNLTISLKTTKMRIHSLSKFRCLKYQFYRKVFSLLKYRMTRKYQLLIETRAKRKLSRRWL